MPNRFEIADVLSQIDHFLENRELHRNDPDLALRFVDQLKKMEIWFLCKVYVDNSKFLHKVVDLCQNGPQNDVRKFMAFARYSFRELGPERFEDRINKSSLTSLGKGMIIGFFRIGEIDQVLVDDISDASYPRHDGIATGGFIAEEFGKEICARFGGQER